MQNNHYQVYLKSVFDLAASLVIKSHKSAELLNTYIDTYYGAGLYNKDDLSTWKYYRNLAGEYFTTDTVMTVTSMDSLEQIEFTKENLAIHTATREGYAYGTKLYRELIRRYPDQTQLIHGILYPAKMDELIAAPDHSLVSWAPEFIMPQETQLVSELQKFIYGYFQRNAIVGFTRSDDLFLAALYSDLSDQLVPQILLIRARYVKTRFAHDYHIHQHLSSHSSLGKYIPMLTRSQTMWLYRNICYIERHSGSGENFDWLVENLLTHRDLPLAAFDMGHDIETMPESLTPEPIFFKRPLNTRTNIDAVNEYSHNRMLALQDTILPANNEFRPDTDRLEDDLVRHSPHNRLTTKTLESTVIDYTDSERTRYSVVALAHWLSLSQKGLYTAYINFEVPSGEIITISVKDAYVLMLWCQAKANGFNISHLPTTNCMKVARTPHPKIESLRQVAPRAPQEALQQLYATMPMARRSISILDFYNQTQALFKAANAQWSIVSTEEHLELRGQLESAAARLWCMETHYLGDRPGQSFDEWFEERNLSFKHYKNEELVQIADIIAAKALGKEYGDTISLKAIQRAMIDILISLSSYSIQIGASINTGPVHYAGCIMVRLGDFAAKLENTYHIAASNVMFKNIQGSVWHSAIEDICNNNFYENMKVKLRAKASINLPALMGQAGFGAGPHIFQTPRKMLAGIGAWCVNVAPLPMDAPRNVPNIPGQAHWLSLTEEQRRNVPIPYKVEL